METALVNRIAAAGSGREGRWFMGKGFVLQRRRKVVWRIAFLYSLSSHLS